MTDTLNCPRCGDYEGDDWTCPDCGVDPEPPPPPRRHRRGRAEQLTAARRAGRIAGGLCVAAAMILIIPATIGAAARLAWHLFLWGWGLIP